jgi:large repetitive protein
MTLSSLPRISASAVLAVIGVGASLAFAAGPAQAASPAPTRTLLTVTTPTIVLGQSAKLKVVVKPVTGSGLPTGSVTVNEGTKVLGTATLAVTNGVEQAKITLTGLALGSQSLTATYGGSAAFATSTSLTTTLTVSKNLTTTTVTAVAAGTPGTYKLSAAVKIHFPGTGFASGLVTFVVDGGAPQIVALNSFGKAPLPVTFVVGSVHTVTASYSGGTTITSSTGTVTFTA